MSLLIAASSVVGHGVVTKIEGANGKTGVGFGVTDVTGKKLRLFNQASRFLGPKNRSVCGFQKLDGKNETRVKKKLNLAKAIKAGLPSADAEGNIKITIFQVNADGAGPYNCKIRANSSIVGKGTFKPMKTIKDVPGVNGSSKARNTAFPLVIQIPAGVKCTGEGNSCLIKCKNGNARRKPQFYQFSCRSVDMIFVAAFGGCFAVTGQGAKARSTNWRSGLMTMTTTTLMKWSTHQEESTRGLMTMMTMILMMLLTRQEA